MYLCDNQFHAEALNDLIDDDEMFGFLIMDGSGALYATIQGSVKNVLYSFSVELPKKHNKGGQSSVRFARLREEARLNYLRKVAECATQQFIKNDKCTVKGLIVAGSAEFKQKLIEDQSFDPRLKDKIIAVVDVAYGGENGFAQAVELTENIISNVKFVHEKNIISAFFNHIALDPVDASKWCFGHKDTFAALESGAVEKLIVFEGLALVRHELKSGESLILNDESTALPQGEESLSCVNLVDWLAEHYTQFGTTLELISDKTPEGAQFTKGFSGIGGILRYPMTFENYDDPVPDDLDFDENDFEF